LNFGFVDRILILADDILNLALRPLGKTLDLERWVADYLAYLLFGASYSFVYRSVDSIFVHRSTSVDSSGAALTKAPKCIFGASIKNRVAQFMSGERAGC
jgi:hypothetical protein